MKETKKYQSFDQSQLISFHLDRISELITQNLSELTEEDFQLYIYQIKMSLLHLDALVDPFKDDSYDEEIISETFDKKDRGKKLNEIHENLKEIMQLLKRKNLIYAATSRKIIGADEDE